MKAKRYVPREGQFIEVETLDVGPTPKKRRRDFILVPGTWRRRLADIRASGCTYQVAMFLLEAARWNERIALSTVGLRKWGVSRNGKRIAIRQLQVAGLISVEERQNRSPIVEPLCLK